MATLKKRINISVSDAVEQAVTLLAKRDEVPQATKVTELLELALELEEDGYFSAMVNKRLAKPATWQTHTEAWE
jgi:predicted DNA-binding protein